MKVTLRDGREVTIRPVRPGDADRLIRFHSSLSTRTIYARYFASHPTLAIDEARRLTSMDGRTSVAYVALAKGRIVGIARYAGLADRRRAEVAFVVADDFQGCGLGPSLFELLVTAARRNGYSSFVGEMLATNRAMRTVFVRSGLPVRFHHSDGVVQAEVDIRELHSVGERGGNTR